MCIQMLQEEFASEANISGILFRLPVAEI